MSFGTAVSDVLPHVAERRENSKIRIAIADDHPVLLDGLCRLLAMEEDFEVVGQAQDGRQVVELLQRHKPDVLLLDLKMPGLHGLAILRQLKAVQDQTRVIVLTASDDTNEFVEAMKLGASGIVFKQTLTELLIKRIREVHRGLMCVDLNTAVAFVDRVAAADQAPPASVRHSAPSDRNRSLLSAREREIVTLVAQGLKNKELAETLFIREQTVKNHLHNIFDKLGLGDRLELALFAVENNLHIR
jgi:DNA-binding NarL/FixJ family response regulator